jgi:hypothetical protein
MNIFYIKLEHNSFYSIEDLAVEAVRLANHLTVSVHFYYEGIKCVADPMGSSDKLATSALNASESRSPLSRASARS